MATDTPDYGPRDIDDEYFQDIYRADRALARAEKGDIDAMLKIGECFYFGEGRDENYRFAIKYLLKPAEMGNADAQFYLGRIYQEGEREEAGAYKGVERNLDEAVKWLSKAAAQGHERAAAALAEMKK